MYPRASQVVKNNFYMDDLLCAVDIIQEAHELKQELIDLLSKGGFELSKWTSNSALLAGQDSDFKEIKGLRPGPLPVQGSRETITNGPDQTCRSKRISSHIRPAGISIPCDGSSKTIHSRIVEGKVRLGRTASTTITTKMD